MLEAIDDDTLIHEARRLSAARRLRRLRTPRPSGNA